MNTIRDVMTANVIWVSPSNIVKTAIILMKGHQIGSLPVVHNEAAVVGMVTYQSLLGEDPNASIMDVMDKVFTTVAPDITVHEAADTMARDNTSHLLVVEDGRLIGIVCHSDLMPVLGKSFDPMTGLPWSDSLREWGMEVLKGGREVILIMMDLNQFGSFNKKHGHVTGDLVLKTVSDVLKSSVDSNLDFLCRYGGDEFCIASIRSLEDAEDLARKLQERVAQIELEDVPEGVTLCFGLFGGRRTKEREDIHFASTLDNLINRASKNCILAKPHREETPKPATASVAPEETVEPGQEMAPREPRLKIVSINFNSSGALATVEVQLSLGSNVYKYAASGYSVGRSALRLVAEATAGAVCRSLPSGYGVVLDEVLTYGLGEDQQIVTVLTVFISPKTSHQCIGTAAVRRGDSYRAAAAAMLCSVNRHLSAAPRVASPAEEDAPE